MKGCKSALHSGLCVVLALAGAKLVTFARTQVPQDDFHEAVARAAKLSALAQPEAPPFHLKLTTQDNTLHNRDYSTEIEVWWAAPDKWRRSVKSPAFTQTAIQNGARYYESNSADYLPYWLEELIQYSIDPIPVVALADVSTDSGGQGCGSWEIYHGSGDQKFSTHAQLCFDPDGTVGQIFAEPIGLQLRDYRDFVGKRIARRLTVWPGDRSDVTATVTILEPLQIQGSGDDGLRSNSFDPPQDTGFASRVRFVSAPESALEQADSSTRPPLTWPSSYTFPIDGAIAVVIHIDRDGNIREFPFAISKNQAITGGAVAQIKNWKFKPYIVDGAPVQVVTTLEVPFHLKYEPLGANGKEFPPISFGDHMRQYRASSDLRSEGSKPFLLRATLLLARGGTGKYEETWRSSAEWTRQVVVGGVALRETRSGEKFTTEFDSDTGRQIEMKAVIGAMQDRLPDPRTFQEADWGNSAVPESNVYPSNAADSSEPVLIRAARGAVNANNHPTSGQAYWFDSKGLLRASFEDNMTVINSNFAPWDLKQVPRRVEVFFGPMPAAAVTVDSIETPQIQDRIAMQGFATSAGVAR